MTIKDQIKAEGKSTGTFHFKQFRVEDGRSTMKVGTDAVLLGAAVDIAGAGTILDVGTGSGVIALMLAQRSEANIDAIDIDPESVAQASENFRNSPWNSRLNAYHTSLQELSRDQVKKYDLVVSNPPFFSRSLKSSDQKKNISRHNDLLSFDELAGCAVKLMLAEASFWVILPVKESPEFLESANRHGLCVHRAIKIFPTPGKCHYRNIFQLKTSVLKDFNEKNIYLRNEDRSYSEDYVRLTGEYYLDF